MEIPDTVPPAATPDITWSAVWGDQIKNGDLIKVAKLGGPVRITSLRRFPHNHQQPRPLLVDEDDDGHWVYGLIVQDREGQQFHIWVQPTDPVFIGTEVPTDLPIIGETEGPSADGALG